jgi:hypothetical protein
VVPVVPVEMVEMVEMVVPVETVEMVEMDLVLAASTMDKVELDCRHGREGSPKEPSTNLRHTRAHTRARW